MESNQNQINEWREKLAAGTLTVADFDDALRQLAAGNGRPRQRLLYLQSRTTGVDSEVLGMSIVEDGEIREGPDDPAQWPYKSVLDAMGDEWRVVKFPEMALLLEEDKTFGLGCEFILEKVP